MVASSIITTVFALVSLATAQCGSGSPDARVTGSGSSFKAVKGSSEVYSGSNYLAAIQAALDSVASGQRVSVIASGSIGASTITITSGKIFEGCGTINAVARTDRGAIESRDTTGVQIPYLTMTGSPVFGMRFSGTRDLTLGKLNFNLSSGMGIRFDRDRPANSNVKMDTISCNGPTSHCVEVWKITGLEINSVIAKNCGESGLLLQNSTNIRVGLVDGDNVGGGTGYGTLRFANNNGQRADGSYTTNVFVDRVKSRGGGRGVFCVSQSGAAEIGTVDLAENGNNAILIENCYGIKIKGGTVNGGGEVRISARTEFPNTKDIDITLQVDNTSLRQSNRKFAGTLQNIQDELVAHRTIILNVQSRVSHTEHNPCTVEGANELNDAHSHTRHASEESQKWWQACQNFADNCDTPFNANVFFKPPERLLRVKSRIGKLEAGSVTPRITSDFDYGINRKSSLTTIPVEERRSDVEVLEKQGSALEEVESEMLGLEVGCSNKRDDIVERIMQKVGSGISKRYSLVIDKA
ncbi:hypothetical protein P153DRAFT_390602 [Dothidotthia symphoricarpi CBS 119687]|uniref:Right handed beta helix domain-containing protein n=1 Tax=Dothidotthia symphoricarpi CBS 119687 TaxID=1392245 RepID=A0A6A5ZXS4_9PLEO|nr:uncharacterized protein P153DRAFT_390602 [Dothidotthia symphoricarpi CBS 119687]KAF2124562.1 hypothetical protein P153DRAFT_390602 [Dothidotthia symphoricarpi CBS 119687]